MFKAGIGVSQGGANGKRREEATQLRLSHLARRTCISPSPASANGRVCWRRSTCIVWSAAIKMAGASMKRILMTGLLLHLVLVAGCTGLQRKYLFYPTHRENDGKLVEWMADGEIIGYCRVVPGASNVWLLMHGNAGRFVPILDAEFLEGFV